MIQESNNFPCKCGHIYLVHGVVDEDRGGYSNLDDGEVGQFWESYFVQVWVCFDCSKECEFEQMSNLEFLEWKHEQKI